MTELPVDIEQLLARARLAEDPSEADQLRVGQALAAKLSIAAADWTTKPQPSAAAAKALAAGGWFKTTALLATLGVACAGGLYAWQRTAAAGRTASGATAARHAVVGATDEPAPTANTTPGASANAAPGATANAARVASANAAWDATANAAWDATANAAWDATANAAPGATANAAPGATAIANIGRQPSLAAVADTPAPMVQPSAADELAPRRSASTAPSRSRPPSGLPVPSLTGSPPPHERASSSWHTAAPRSQPSAASASPGVLEQELALMQRASRALDDHDPASTLSLVQLHGARFRHGFLVEERDALRIAALCDLAEPAEASKLRNVFEQHHARSPLRQRIAAHCDHATDAER